MKIELDYSLKNYNTFGIDVTAAKFIEVGTIDQLIDVLKTFPEPKFLLGGGSNMLLTKNIDALVIHLNLKGKRIEKQDDSFAWVRAEAGENWHEFVLFCIENNLGGLENMSLIPGNVGTTPVQNIGAYGTEIKDSFVSCEAINLETFEVEEFSNSDCNFGYRESIFKNEKKDKYIITSVLFKLTKKDHLINIDYGDITKQLAENHVTNPTLKDVSNAVIAIRKSKLPDPKDLGNSGSFFKNPIIPKRQFDTIYVNFPQMPHYHLPNNMVKVPAGWLIEQAGFKGKRFGDAGIHKNQALVLVNYGNASGLEILAVARDIQNTVLKKYGIAIEAEVNII